MVFRRACQIIAELIVLYPISYYNLVCVGLSLPLESVLHIIIPKLGVNQNTELHCINYGRVLRHFHIHYLLWSGSYYYYKEAGVQRDYVIWPRTNWKINSTELLNQVFGFQTPNLSHLVPHSADPLRMWPFTAEGNRIRR